MSQSKIKKRSEEFKRLNENLIKFYCLVPKNLSLFSLACSDLDLKSFIFEKLAQNATFDFNKNINDITGVFFRAQPNGKDLMNHVSGLAYEKVPGIFAFDDPIKLFDTYSWLHMKKNIDNYELVTFEGKLIDSPEDSEGVVVKPEHIIAREPLRDFASKHIEMN